MNDNVHVFHRLEIAERIAAALLGDDVLSSAGHSGLFLSAPRRTGKTTFLRNDLIPVLERVGAIAVYVDLWTDKARNPSDLIAEAVRDALALQATTMQKAGGLLGRIKKASAKGKVAGFEAEFGYEIDTVGKPGGVTLARAFEGLNKRTGKPIVIIIDEAQHALSTEEGSATLFALKAARDALNLTAGKPQLAILATGSVRGKLSDMVMRKNQAFFGATVADFPILGEDFVRHLAQRMLSHRLRDEQLPSTEKLNTAFKLLWYRPEELNKTIAAAVVRSEPDLGDAVVAAAKQRHRDIIEGLKQQVAEMPALQRSILRVVAERRADVTPFGKETMAKYRADVGDAKASTGMVQKALGALVSSGLVWRSSVGVYDLDDEMLADFFFDPESSRVLAAPVAPEPPVARRRPRA
jgi:hypothetical protein